MKELTLAAIILAVFIGIGGCQYAVEHAHPQPHPGVTEG